MTTPSRSRWGFALLPLLLLVVGCHSPTTISGDDAKTHTFAAQGEIEKIAPDQDQVTIHHQTIPGYMMEMTMDFPVKDPVELQGLVPGDQVTFDLVVGQDDDFVTHLKRIGHIDPTTYAPKAMTDTGASDLKPGDKLPDAELIAEDGRRIHFSDFRGKAVAFTFFFTRCPLPNYCPLMNHNFALARKLLVESKGPTNWEFLSISFDSEFDQPRTLAGYAGFYRQDNPDRWLFAAAPPASLAQIATPVGLVIMRQGTNLSHNLRTVVVDPEGCLYRQFNDNRWTPRELADAVQQAAQRQAKPRAGSM